MTFFEISEQMAEIEKALDECIDPETGEVLDDKYQELQEKYRELNVAEADKAEGVCLMVKNKEALLSELKAEKKRITDRIGTLTNDIDRTKDFIDRFVLKGQKFETAKVRCVYRKSKAVEVADESIVPKEYMVEKVTVAPDKKAIKDALTKGEVVQGCNLIENNNLSIK